MSEQQKLYITHVRELGTRRVTSEFFTDINGFDLNDRRDIAHLEVDKLLIVRGRQSNSVRRVK